LKICLLKRGSICPAAKSPRPFTAIEPLLAGLTPPPFFWQVLDKALLRAGRLSRKVIVPLPDEAGRAKIMAVHLRKTPMATQQLKEQSCAMVASISTGMSGAELANVCNEAALLAGRRSAEVCTLF